MASRKARRSSMRWTFGRDDSKFIILGLMMLCFSLGTILVMWFNLSAMERNRTLVYRTLALDIGRLPMNYLLSRDDFQRRKEIIVIAISGIMFMLMVNGALLYFMIQGKQRLREAEYTKSEMISALTHDARFYLTVLKGRVDLLRMKSEAGTLGDGWTHDLRLVSENAASLNRLLVNLNDHEMLVKGKVGVIFQWVYLKTWLPTLLSGFEVLAQSHEIQLSIAPHETSYPIYTDAHLVEQILLNLVHNAHKFSPLELPIQLELSAAPGWYRLLIIDQGEGIPASEHERIFEPYVQLHSKFKGKGLGLSNARQFAQLLGGTLDVLESQPGRRTAFCLALPAPDPKEVP